jgi:DNA-binding response OmpR family regulator
MLAVDDEQDIVNLIKQSLEANEFEVCSFTDIKLLWILFLLNNA